MSNLAFTRTGGGEPLVLLHGIGSFRQAWDPVLPALAPEADVIAVDLPGFGDSPPLPATVEPSPAALALAVVGLLDELGLDVPHVAGNSLGGWVALELAAVRPVASLTLLSPAGLWRGGTPLYCRASLRASWWLARHARRPVDAAVGTRAGRALVFGQVLGRPTRMSPVQAHAAIHALADAPGFDATLRATGPRRVEAAQALDVPVTVAFGSRDRLLLARSWRRLDELPAGTRVAALPGCGHVPMTDDPAAVAALLAAPLSRGGRAPAFRGSSGRPAPRSVPLV
ncbi:MAG: alpha/beta fold hydrolase [Kineosporiaceae bacterium]